MRKILLLTLGSLFACIIHAQIATDELPYGLLNNVRPLQRQTDKM